MLFNLASALKSVRLKMLYSFVCLLFAIAAPTMSELINKEVNRIIKIEGELLRIMANITIENNPKESYSSYNFSVEPASTVAFISFKSSKGKLKYTIDPLCNNNYTIYLPFSLKPMQVQEIQSEMVLVGQVQPEKKTRTFSEYEKLIYQMNLKFYSAYFTRSSTTSIIVNGKMNEPLKSYNYQPFTIHPYTFNVETEDALIRIKHLERTIDISHYGKIHVKEEIILKHIGAKFVGPYYTPKSNEMRAGAIWFYGLLPPQATNIKFYDAIGNSSRTLLTHLDQFTLLKFAPRYPLLGGWQTTLTWEYLLPSHFYLYQQEDKQIIVEMPAIQTNLDDLLVEKAHVQVVLPEFATEINLVPLPNGFEMGKEEKTITSLTIVSRAIVTFHGFNLTNNHIENFVLKYHFHSLLLLKAPLLLSFYVYMVFLLLILYFRTDFSLSPNQFVSTSSCFE